MQGYLADIAPLVQLSNAAPPSNFTALRSVFVCWTTYFQEYQLVLQASLVPRPTPSFSMLHTYTTFTRTVWHGSARYQHGTLTLRLTCERGDSVPNRAMAASLNQQGWHGSTRIHIDVRFARTRSWRPGAILRPSNLSKSGGKMQFKPN